MNITEKTNGLNELYQIFHSFMASEPTACISGCSHCCTRNVTLTTLEGLYLLEASTSDTEILVNDPNLAPKSDVIFRPEVTINELARLCIEDKPLPEETSDPASGPCPLLINNRCAVYVARPFSCRCMMSTVRCDALGAAEVKDRWITAGTVFQQAIEQLDQGGLFGNLSDVLRLLQNDTHRRDYKAGRIQPNHPNLLSNQPLPAIMIPPEHRDFFRPMWDRIRSILNLYRAYP